MQDFEKNEQSENAFLQYLFIIVDVLLILSIFIPSGIFYLAIKPFQRGFFCDDESIFYPYKEDTVGIKTVILLGLFLPIIGIIIIEIFYFIHLNNKKWIEAEIWPRFYANQIKLSPITSNISNGICYFLMGLSITLVFTEMTKIIIGRLRPHFIDVCQPNWSQISCTQNLFNGFVKHTYVNNNNNICLTTNKARYWEARKSFPSGHSSVAIYCMLFLSLYIQYRIHWKKMYFLKGFLQTIFMLLAIACALSRISDYKHHWSDVLAGAIIGAIVAYFDIFFIWNLPCKYKLLEKRIQITKNEEAMKQIIVTSPSS